MITENLDLATLNGSAIHLNIKPFQYKDGRNPRLPRKRSDGYNLREDINLFFSLVFHELDVFSTINKFNVDITINCANDRLGKADLDNYSKAILDGITTSKKIWNDDKQIDILNPLAELN